MNEEKIRKLIDHLKQVDENLFRMDHWLIFLDAVDSDEAHLYTINSLEHLDRVKKENQEKDWCGTAGCIAGHTCMLFPGEGYARDYSHIPSAAARILELNHEEQVYLFTPRNVDDLSDVTLAQAIVVLEHFLATGEVDWTLEAEVSHG